MQTESACRWHEVLSISLLGLGTMFLYLGWFMQCFVSESVINAVHGREPNRIDANAGYYGQAIHQSIFTVACLLAPRIHYYLGTKLMLFMSAVFFSIYYTGFFHIHSYQYYASLLCTAFAYAFYNQGEGAYISEHSSRRTVEVNSIVETSIGHSSMFFGGLVLFAVFYFVPQKTNSHHHYRDFSDRQIQAVYGMFLAVTVLAGIIFAVMPSKQQKDSIALNSRETFPEFKAYLKNLLKATSNGNVVLVYITCAYMGIYVSFLLGIYPTALSFTSSLSNDQYLIAFYATSIGVAEITGGLLLEPLIKRVGERKLQVLMLVHVVIATIAMTLFVLTIPSMSTMIPNAGPSHLLHPSRLLTCLNGYLIGMGDFTLTASRVTICQLVLPENLIEVYSVTRAFQCISSCAVFYLSCRMSVECWAGTILGAMVLGVTSLLYVDRRTRRKESVASTTPSEKEACPFPESSYIDCKVY